MSALIWKEWRENRLGLLLFIVSTFLIFWTVLASKGVSEIALDVTVMFFVPAYIALVGASTIAPEVGEGTLSFLLSRPVSRGKIWAAKIVTGLLLSVLATVGLLGLCLCVLPGDRLDVIGSLLERNWQSSATLVVALLVVFSSATFLSTVFDRAIPAFLGSILLVAGLCAISIGTDLDLLLVLPHAGFVVSCGLLLGSLLVFSKGELLAGPRKYALALAGLAGTAVLFCGSMQALGLLLAWCPANNPDYRAQWEQQSGSIRMRMATDRILGIDRTWAVVQRGPDQTWRPAGAPYLQVLSVLPDGRGFLAQSVANRFGLPSLSSRTLEMVPFEGRPVKLEGAGAVRPGYGMRYSANGRRAVMRIVGGERRGDVRDGLALVDLDRLEHRVLASFDRRTVDQYCWRDDGRTIRFLRIEAADSPARSLWEITADAMRTEALRKIALPRSVTDRASGATIGLTHATWHLLPDRGDLLACVPGVAGRRLLCRISPGAPAAVWTVDVPEPESVGTLDRSRWLRVAGFLKEPSGGGWSTWILDFETGRVAVRWSGSFELDVCLSPDALQTAHLSPDRSEVVVTDLLTGKSRSHALGDERFRDVRWIDATHLGLARWNDQADRTIALSSLREAK